MAHDPALFVAQPFYIQTRTPPEGDTRVLKQGETFAIFDHYGDILPSSGGKEGIFHEGTRHLSGLLLRLGGDQPMYLSSTVRQENDLLTVDLTNLDVTEGEQVVIPRHPARGPHQISVAGRLLRSISFSQLWPTDNPGPVLPVV